MTIVDRYLLAQFLKIFLVCLVSFAGLFVVIHVFTNLDEVVTLAGQEGGMQNLLIAFYGPRVLDFFNRMAGILVLVSAVFAISMMQRRREATATEAAGITKARLVVPIIVAAMVIIGLAAVCRELYIPQYRSALVRSLSNWTSNGSVVMHHQKDVETGILVQGNKLFVDQAKITEVQVTLPRHLGSEIIDIQAGLGFVQNEIPEKNVPNGLLLKKNIEPSNLIRSPSIQWEGKTIVYTPKDFGWLRSDEVFVVCSLDVQEMAYGENLYLYSSLPEMIDSLKKPSRRFGLGDQVAIHDRILKPLMEFTLLLIGLPLVVSNPNRNIFMGAALCALIIILMQVTTVASHAAGGLRMIQPASLAAWLPVIVFLPLSAFSLRKLFD